MKNAILKQSFINSQNVQLFRYSYSSDCGTKVESGAIEATSVQQAINALKKSGYTEVTVLAKAHNPPEEL